MVSEVDHVDELLWTYKSNHKQALKECDKRLKKQPKNEYLTVRLYLSSLLRSLTLADFIAMAYRDSNTNSKYTRGRIVLQEALRMESSHYREQIA